MLRAGVDLGGTKIQSVIVDGAGVVHGTDRRPTPRAGGPADVTAAVAGSVLAAISDSEAEPDQVVAVGVGSPGQIDRAEGTVSNAGNLPDWSQAYPLGPVLAEHLHRPVFIGNDVQVAVEAEAVVGAGRTFTSFLGVFVGTGIGGGLVMAGRLWLGRGAAGEIGHMVVAMDGRQCRCGRRGCVEAYAGRAAMEATARRWVAEGRKTALFDLMEAKGQDRLTSGVWSRALEQQDAVAQELIAEAGQALGAGIASAINLLDVGGVIIGGGLGTRLGASFLQAIRTAALEHMLRPDQAPEFRVAALGDLGGAIGAAMLAGEAGQEALAVAGDRVTEVAKQPERPTQVTPSPQDAD